MGKARRIRGRQGKIPRVAQCVRLALGVSDADKQREPVRLLAL